MAATNNSAVATNVDEAAADVDDAPLDLISPPGLLQVQGLGQNAKRALAILRVPRTPSPLLFLLIPLVI